MKLCDSSSQSRDRGCKEPVLLQPSVPIKPFCVSQNAVVQHSIQQIVWDSILPYKIDFVLYDFAKLQAHARVRTHPCMTLALS